MRNMNPSKAIKALQALGMTESEIGAALGIHQSVVNRIKHGTIEPRYTLGVAIVNMAQRRISRAAKSAA